MEIEPLSTVKKKMNAIFLIGIIVSIHFFYNEKFTLTTFLTVVSFIAIGITLLIGFIKLFIQSKLQLKQHDDYVLFINSDTELESITKAHQIEYTKNYLKNSTLNLSIELTNKEALKLIKDKPIKNIKVYVAYKKTPFLEQNPIEWLKSLMSMAEATS